MAQRSLVVDASVAVKWFSTAGEISVRQAIEFLEGHVTGEIVLAVPDLLYYEVANALVHKNILSNEKVELAIKSLFSLGLHTYPMSAKLMTISAGLARKFDITVYDACYIALAQECGCSLVTANPRHQKQSFGCEVIPL